MHYEINISLNGLHYFATASRSLTTETQAISVHKKLLLAFPVSEGYKLTVSYHRASSRFVDTAKWEDK